MTSTEEGFVPRPPSRAAAPTYTEVPARLTAHQGFGDFYRQLPDLLPRISADPAAYREEPGPTGALARRLASLPPDGPVEPSKDGDVEQLGEVMATHRFVDAPGDSETVTWHLVDAGAEDGEVVVFLHGVPDSWWQWHHAIEALAPSYRCLAVDLKGYGQSDKRTGDYRQEGVAEQLIALLDELGVERFTLVTHDRGTPPADHIAAKVPERVVRYGRGQQHLWHYHPALSPQEAMFASPQAPFLLGAAREFVALAYTLLTAEPASTPDLARTVAEFSYQGIATAVPRYFHSSSFRQEWIDRRTRLIPRWQAPVTLLQGRRDPGQPHEFYTDDAVLERLPEGSSVHLFDAGHFWPFEVPDDTNAALTKLMSVSKEVR